MKRSGKKVVPLAEATQLFFGIKSHRWNDHPLISPLHNERWVWPAYPWAQPMFEQGCYW